MTDRPPLPAGQPDELSPLDYLLHRGEAYPATRSAFCDLEILDRPADWGRLREAMDRASRVVIRMRQKVVIPPSRPRHRGGSSIPTSTWTTTCAGSRCPPWHDAPAPRPGRGHAAVAARHLARPLGGGVRGGPGRRVRSALLIKLSHAITDGLGGLALFEQIYDTERDPEPRPMPPVPIPRDLSGNDLLRDSLRQLPETTLATGWRLLGRAAGTAARLVAQPGEHGQPRPSASPSRRCACSARRRPSHRRCCAAGAW